MTDTKNEFGQHQHLANILLDMGCKKSHVKYALQRAEQTGESLPSIMRDFGFLSGEQVAESLAKLMNLPYFPASYLDEVDFSELTEKFQIDVLKGFVPLGIAENGAVYVGISDISQANAAKNYFYQHKTEIVIASSHTIQTAYRQHFARTEAAFDEALQAFINAVMSKKDEDSGLMTRVFNSLIRHACYSGASDLYIHRSEEIGVIKLKINGTGKLFRSVPNDAYDRVMNKLIQENTKPEELAREPQEAQIQIKDETGEFSDIANRYSFRLELAQTRNNEKTAVVRILDRQSNTNELDKLGFDDPSLAVIKKAASAPTGLVIITGPTGSGKTSSLYAILKSIDPVERSVQTIENPIEFRHGLWLQYELPKQVDGKSEAERAALFLKALLRNAPDVILMGETRDAGVANVLLDAANTGHLAFTTLHTNTAASALGRLKRLGIDMDTLASVLLMIMAQRLVRTLCPVCRKPDHRPETLEFLKSQSYLRDYDYNLYTEGDGCSNCDYSGFRGRRMIYEVLEINTKVRTLIEEGASISAVARAGIPEGGTMWENGLKLVCQGLTSFDEIKRRASETD